MTKHSASCLGYICTCDNCYRCEGIIKDLRAENARYRKTLEVIAIINPQHKDYPNWTVAMEGLKICGEIAREALKGVE